jgi:hypothetical protein
MNKIADFQMNEIKTAFEIVTKVSVKNKAKLLRWFIRQNIEFQLLIFEKQGNYYFKLKEEGTDKKLLSFASFILAIKEFFDNEQLLKSKNKSQRFDSLGKLSKLEKIKFRKEKFQPKQEMLLNMHSVVESLFLDGFSSRKIQKYIFQKHKKDISHTLISNYINKYINTRKENKNV